MADYAFSMTVTGYVSGTTSIQADLRFSDGSTASKTEPVNTPGDPVGIFAGPVPLTGTETLWITFYSLDVSEVKDVKTIGPYLVSEVGLLP